MAAVKDAWQPFQSLLELMAAHGWMFPTGWGLAILLHWLTIGAEMHRQIAALNAIRRRTARPRRPR